MSDQGIIKKYLSALKKLGSQRKAAEHIGVPRSTVQLILSRNPDLAPEQAEKPVKAEKTPTFGSSPAPKRTHITTKPGETRSFIFTAAQDDSAVHEDFLANLVAYAEHLGAEIKIAGFTYDKSLYSDHEANTAWYHESIQPYLTSESLVINDSLVFCAEMNTLPTAVNPLSGFEVYTRHRSGIFPHAKVQLQSVPTMKGHDAKQIMTTGAVTVPNYVRKRAGIKASFHHVIGAVLVEVDSDGDWFARHLIAEDDGSFQDLTTRVDGGQISLGYRVEAITWGDIHFPQTDADVASTGWGWEDSKGGALDADQESMLDTLEPVYQFIHDASDFWGRNHHNSKDPHHAFRAMLNGQDDISTVFAELGDFLQGFRREWSEVVVVESNHDLAFSRWLREADWKTDPINAELYLEGNLAVLTAIRDQDENFRPLEWALKRGNDNLDDLKFLGEEESFRICVLGERDQGIECGAHGHLGANGARATPKQFTRMGPKATTGHTHSCGIIDGIYTAGTSSKLDLGYNKGLSSWSHSHVIAYPSGKRTIVTMRNGKWRA